jgi:uncharacterized protein HemX
MKNHILKLALGALALAALGYAGYRFMQQRQDRVEVQGCKDQREVKTQSYDEDLMDDEVEIQSRSSSSSASSSCKSDNQSCQSSMQCCSGLQCKSNPIDISAGKTCMTPKQIKEMSHEG